MKISDRLNDLRELNKADILAAIGLASKPSASERILGSLSIFGVGLLVGAGAALLLAPKTGEDLRGDLGQRIRKLREERQSDSATGVNSSVGSMGALGRDEIRT